jgi:hypothetical protein
VQLIAILEACITQHNDQATRTPPGLKILIDDVTSEASEEEGISGNDSEETSKEPAGRSANRDERRRRKAARNKKDKRALGRSPVTGAGVGEEQSGRGSTGSDRRAKRKKQPRLRHGVKKREAEDVDVEALAPRAARRRSRKGTTGKIAEFVEQAIDHRTVSAADLLEEAPEFSEEALLEQAAQDDELEGAADGLSRGSRRTKAIDPSKPVSISIVASDLGWAHQFFVHLQEQCKPANVVFETGAADVVVDFDGWQVHGRTPARGRKETIIVAGATRDTADQQTAANVAHSTGALLLPLELLVRRYGHLAAVDDLGVLNNTRLAVLAKFIGSALTIGSRSAKLTAPPDLEQARAIADDPALLETLNWPSTAPPQSFRLKCRRQTVEDFLDGKVSLTRKEPRVTFAPLLLGNANLSASAETALYSLGFVSEVLTYWFAKANRVSPAKYADIDAVLKTRNITASELLAQAGEILVQVAENSERVRDSAWLPRTMESRAVAFELFLLCCRIAAARKIRFDHSHCGPVFRGLLQLLEELRPTALHVGAATAVNCLGAVAALALPLRKMAYGEILLADATEWLSALQLDAGMSPDGVWHEGFAQHGSVVSILSTLTADLRVAEVTVRPISTAMTKLARFTDAVLAERGACPPIDELPGAAYPMLQKLARVTLAKSAAATNLLKKQDGSRDTVLFRDSGYFVSRSANEDRKLRSHLVVHARQAQQGGPSLSFSLDGKALLIGGGTVDSRASREIRRASRADPAAHNALRVNGQTYAALASDHAGAVRIDKFWDQPHWAAVRMLDAANETVRLARTVIHLKPGHALIIIDELEARQGEAQFEQFWHFAPSLRRELHGKGDLTFRSAEGGVFHAAFDTGPTLALSEGGTGAIGWTSPKPGKVIANPYIRRERQATNAVMVAFFQWRRATREFEIAAEGGFGSWHATVTTAGATLSYKFAAGELQLVD